MLLLQLTHPEWNKTNKNMFVSPPYGDKGEQQHMFQSPPFPAVFALVLQEGGVLCHVTNPLRLPAEYAKSVKASTNRTSRFFFTLHAVARKLFSEATRRWWRIQAELWALRSFFEQNNWIDIMATDVVDDREMREAQRDYLDFLDDDVSWIFDRETFGRNKETARR